MPPNQQVMGGCNQIISLRFGFPNSFPLILSTDHSLALKKGDRRRGGGRTEEKRGKVSGEENDYRRKLDSREEWKREDMIEE